MRFIMGLDLGQSTDYTAIVVAEKVKEDGRPACYHIRHVERVPLGTSYHAVVMRVQALLATEPLCRDTLLVVDATGVGAPVVDLLRKSGLRPICVSIHAGDQESREGDAWRVPKRNLVATLQVLLQRGGLKIAEGLPEAHLLVQEMLAFRVRIDPRTAHDSYAAWREGAHDDLVLAAALAVWYGEQKRGVFYA